MARRLLVSSGDKAKEADTYKVSAGGKVKPVKIACVVDQGMVRQFWDSAGGLENETITWTTEPITVIQSAVSPAPSIAFISFTRASGLYLYSNHPGVDGFGFYIRPPLDGTAADNGKFVIRTSQISGDALTGTLGIWLELNQDHQWSLDQSIIGTSNAVAEITIAEDAGGGLPQFGTEVTKPVTFISTVTPADNLISWSADQWDLVEIKEAEDATCELLFEPTGWALGISDVNYTESWHVNAAAIDLPDAADFTVTVTLDSGDAPSGILGSPVPLSDVQYWILTATLGELKQCSLSVVVADTTYNFSKIVTMRSEYPVNAEPPVWTDTPWNLLDWPQALALLTTATISFNPNGIADAVIENQNGGPEEQASEPWHVDAPIVSDTENYEVMLEDIGGGSVIGLELGIWYTLDQQRIWIVERATRPAQRSYEYQATVRLIGSAGTAKPITITVLGDDGSVPP